MERKEIEQKIERHKREIAERHKEMTELLAQLDELSARVYEPYSCPHCRTQTPYGQMILVRYFYWYSNVRSWWAANRDKDYVCCPRCLRDSRPTDIRLDGMLRDPDIFADQIESQGGQAFNFIRIDGVDVHCCHSIATAMRTLAEIPVKRTVTLEAHWELEERKQKRIAAQA